MLMAKNERSAGEVHDSGSEEKCRAICNFLQKCSVRAQGEVHRNVVFGVRDPIPPPFGMSKPVHFVHDELPEHQERYHLHHRH